MAPLNLHTEPLRDEWLDAYGHLNEACYLLPFTNATWKLQEHFTIGVDYFESTGCALYTVETHVQYLKEVRAPAKLEIQTQIIGAYPKKLWYAHQMIVDGELRCRAEFMALHYSTREQRVIPFPEPVITRLRTAVAAETPDWVSGRINPQ